MNVYSIVKGIDFLKFIAHTLFRFPQTLPLALFKLMCEVEVGDM